MILSVSGEGAVAAAANIIDAIQLHQK